MKNKEQLKIKLKEKKTITFMFGTDESTGCAILKLPDIYKWDTKNVTNMGFLFSLCKISPFPDITKWDIKKIKDMSGMFCGCLSLSDISNWETRKVINMCGIFENCTLLSSLPDISK